MPADVMPASQESHDVSRRFTSLLPIAIVLVAIVSGCDHQAVETEPVEPVILTVNIIEVQPEARFIETAIFYGKLTPQRQSSLGFARGGRLQTLTFHVGEPIADGEEIALLDQGDLPDTRKDLITAIGDLEDSLDEPPTPPFPAASTGTPTPASQQEFAKLQREKGTVQQLQSLRRELETVEREIAKATIVAPYDCRISETFAEVGNTVAGQTRVLHVVEDAKPLLKVDLPRRIAKRLAPGDAMNLSVAKQLVEAKVLSKSPVESAAGDKTVLFEITGDFANVDWSFGETVEAHFRMTTDSSGFWLPMSALQGDSHGLWRVLVATESNSETRLARTSVEVVELRDDWALVRGKLSAGQQVVVNGAHRVVAGQHVTISDVSAEFPQPESAGATE